jgi:hypothetical protein
MLTTKTYEQTAVFDPTNPYQRRRETHAYPGDGTGYSSFYFNQIPSTSSLHGFRGLRGLNGFDTLPGWAQIGIVGGISALIGYFAMERYGDRIKPVVKKIPIVGGALSGYRRRR